MNQSTDSGGPAIPIDPASLSSWAMRYWANALEAVIESMTAARPTVSFQPASGEDGKTEGASWLGQSLSLVPAPALWIGASAASWHTLGQKTLAALGVDEASDSDIEATCRDLLAQSSSAFAQDLAGELEETITGGSIVPSDQPECVSSETFTFTMAGPAPFEGTALLDRAFLERLEELAQQVRRETEASAVTPDAGGSESQAQPEAAQPQRPLPKVQLRVRVVLGRARLSLRDLFKLNVGSVIELDRLITDVADVMIGDHKIASGPVVVVNGNYGVRVSARK